MDQRSGGRASYFHPLLLSLSPLPLLALLCTAQSKLQIGESFQYIQVKPRCKVGSSHGVHSEKEQEFFPADVWRGLLFRTNPKTKRLHMNLISRYMTACKGGLGSGSGGRCEGPSADSWDSDFAQWHHR